MTKVQNCASWWSLALVAGLALVASGQLPLTELTTIYPLGAKPGATLEVTVGGGNQDDLTALEFSHPGIKATQKTNPPAEFYKDAVPVNNVFTVTIAADVPPGIYDARVRGRFGASNPRAFVVGSYEEMMDDGSNATLETAKEVAVGTTVTGRADANVVNYFKVALKAGQRVIFDCLAKRVDSKLDGTLVLYDSTGKELLRVRDSIGKDPLIDFSAPADGTFTVGLHDHIYGGGAELFYRLSIHAGTHVDYVFPPAGLPGSNGEYTLYGRNLPGGEAVDGLTSDGQPLQQLKVKIPLPGQQQSEDSLGAGSPLAPARILLNGYDYRYAQLNPIRIGFAAAPVTIEQEPNDAAGKAQKVVVPCEVAGRFYPQRDIDWVEFEAKKGSVYRVDLISHRLGLETDADLLVQRVTKNDKGEEQVADVTYVDDVDNRNGRIGGDFDYSTNDPSYRFAVPEDGVYRVRVRDSLGTARSDGRYIYRLQIRSEVPDFRLIANARQLKVANANTVSYYSPVLRKGGTAVMELVAVRQDGFGGEIEIAVEGLPEGVECAGATLPSNASSVWLVFKAQDEVKDWMGPIRIVGKAKVGDRDVARYARIISVVWNTGNRTTQPAYFRVMRDLVLSVTSRETYPALVQVGDGKPLETSRGGKIDVPIKVARRLGFGEKFKLIAQNVPGEVKPGDLEINGDKSEGTLAVHITNAKAKVGLYNFYLRSDTKVKIPRNADAVARAEAEQKLIVAAVAQVAEELKAAKAELDAAAKSAGEAAKSAKDGADEAKKKAAEAEEVRKKAEAKHKEIEEKNKRVQAAKTAADKKVTDVKKANEPKDLNFAIVSTPIQLRVVDTPLKIAAGNAVVKAAAKIEVPVSLERLYGFADAVEITVEFPKGVAGLAVEKLSIAKDQKEAKLQLAATDKAPVGDHSITIRAKAKFNNIDVQASQQIVLKVEAAAEK